MHNRNGAQGRSAQKNKLIVICCVLALVLVALIVIAVMIQKDPEKDPLPETTLETSNKSEMQYDLIPGPMEEMVIHTVEEQDDVICVTTSYGNFTYPYAFSDLIAIEPLNEENCVGLAFSVFIGGRNEPAYSLWINSDRGIPTGVLHMDEVSYRVSLELMDAREGLKEDYLSTFYAVQETLNDVLQSMASNGNFEYIVGGNS